MTSDDDSGAPRPRRRQVLRAATATVLGAGVVTGTGAGILRALNSEDGSGEGRLLLQTDATSGVGILEKPLADLGLAKTGTGLWQTPVLDTALVTMVGFTWRDGGPAPKILVRFRGKGGWSLWRPAPLLRDLPDPSTGEGIGKAGTVPLVVEPSDGVQVQVSGSVPPELSITLIHAAPIAGDARLLAGSTSRSLSRAAAVGVAVPSVYTRAQWGANECWRDGPPRYNSTILQAHVHHSASGNGYAQADVPALIRSFYRYHTHSLGWSDIAYNFLVDAYGTIWEGRYGGMDQAVRGRAHARLQRLLDRLLRHRQPRHRPAHPGDAGLAGEARRLEALHVRPRPAGLDPGHVRGQRQVPEGPGGHAAGHRRTPRHQRHRLPRRQPLRPARTPCARRRPASSRRRR